MKNKRIFILFHIMVLLILVSCGKKNQPITENPEQKTADEISGEVIDFTADGLFSDALSNPGDSNPGDSDPDSVSSDIADGVADTPSDNDVSGEDIEQADNSSQPLDTEAFLEELGARSNCIYIANMTGKDIKVLTLTFSEGEVRGGEILAGSVLKDGELFTYAATDINALQNATGLRLTVTATAKDDTVMAFPEVRVINPAGCTVILSRGHSTSENAAGYTVYIE